MPRFDTINDLIGELYRNRNLFSTLFDKRMYHVQEEMVLPLVDDDTDKLERLAAYGMLFRNQSQLSLDTRLQEFFEDFLEVDEDVHVLYIQDHLNQIKNNQSYFLKERVSSKRDQYLVKIKKNLRSIIRITLMNVKTLRNNTDETYKTETNFEIKKEKLNDVRSQRDALEGVIRTVERLLADELLFKSAADDELLMIVHQLRMALNDSFHNLIEIQQQIIEYLNHIERRVLVVEKVLQLKMLHDKHHLKERTNFHQKAAANYDLPLRKTESFRTRLSIHEMLEDEGKQQLVLRVREKLKNRKLLKQDVAGEMADGAFLEQQSVEPIVNLKKLKDVFLGKDLDLFSFVMHHQFSQEVSKKERIRLYCRLASLYEPDFLFTDNYQVDGALEYAIIYPGKRA
ncbi:MAG: hypothetical protein KBH01_05620 [Breznakibacter sp.]|nr:hypothetical protein [Breznakibacter sp.]